MGTDDPPHPGQIRRDIGTDLEVKECIGDFVKLSVKFRQRG